MSKGKKGGKAQPESVVWDEPLVNEVTEDDLWHPYIIFLVGESTSGEAHIQALSEGIKDGNKLRKRFVNVTKEDLLKIAQEDSTASLSSAGGKKSKLGRPASGSGSSAQKPSLLHPQVCEKMVTAASSGEPIPLSLTARMIKYIILKRRVKFIYERELPASGNAPEQEKKSSVISSDKKRSRSPSGRTSKAAKKTKEPSQPEIASVPVPPKPPTEMKKRGEEDEEAKYINDEPDPGPSCYFVFSGFTSLDLFNHFVPIKLRVNALVKIMDKEKASDVQKNVSLEASEEEQAINESLSIFWADIDQMIRSSRDGSMLRDMARVQLQLKFLVIPQDETKKAASSQVLFDDLAQKIYTLLKLYTLYQHYLNYLQVYTIPVKDSSAPHIDGRWSSTTFSSATEVKPECKPSDMRLYTNFLSDTPQENITIPLMLHAMVEQVSAVLTEAAPSSTICLTPMNPEINAELMNIMNDLALSKEDKTLLGIDHEATHRPNVEQMVISHGDDLSRRSLNLPASSASKKKFEEDLLRSSGLNSVFLLADLTNTDKKSEMQALNHFVCCNSNLPSSQFSQALILLSLDSIDLPSASIPPSFNFRQPQASSLLFDHPFNFDLISKDKSLVPVSECPHTKSTDTITTSEGDSAVLSSHMLNISHRQCKLLDYSTFEVFDFHGLLQELISAKDSHPYIEVYEHKHTESIIIVLHTGFTGSPTHSYMTSSHVHTKVGFTNFLDYILEKYGLAIEEAVMEDEKKEMEFKESQIEIRDSMMMLKIKEAAERQQQQQEGLFTVVEEETSNTAINTTVSVTPVEKGRKKASAMSQKTPDSSKATSAKKKSKSALEASTTASPSPCLPEEPQYEAPKHFTGYDLGDIVLLKESICSTAFTADGAQLRTTRLLAEKDCQAFSSEILVNHKRHIFTISQVWLTREQGRMSDSDPLKSGQHSTDEAQNEETATRIPVIKEQPLPAGVPLPPSLLQHAQMTACFSNSLRLSYSYYGPKGNGEVPFLPSRPTILDAPPTSEIPRPSSQQNASQKLTKKQLEQQQQLLEQQRLKEERLEAERKQAQAKYEQDCINVSRNNKYQQLFISTECGLNVHCHPMVNPEADPSTVDGTDAFTVIKQWYSHPATVGHLSQNIANERARYYHPEGYVVKYMMDKSVQVMGAYGHRYRPAVGKELEALQDESASTHDMSDTHTSIDQSARLMASATKVTFADNQKDIAVSDHATWVITTPLGKSYLWKPAAKKRKESEVETTETTVEADEPNDTVPQEDDNKPMVVELDQLRFVRATDPVTNEVYITREDNVVLVQHPNGSYVTQFEDGTRFTVSFSEDQGPTDITVESESFATVHYATSANVCHLEFPDQSTVTCFTNGKYEVMKQDHYEFIIECNGKADYSVPHSTYSFDHTKQDGILYCKDRNSNTFSVNYTGEIEAEALNPVEHVAFEPRYFILKDDKSAYELHRNTQVDEFIANVSAHDATVVVNDALPNQPDATTTTVIEPIHNTKIFPVGVQMKKDNIVPYNLRCGNIRVTKISTSKPKPKFGAMAGRGLSIGKQGKPKPLGSQFGTPLALRYRQFLQFRPLTNIKIDKVYDILASFIEHVTENVDASNEMKPVDTRSTPERELLYSLQSRFPELFPPSDIKRLYENGLEEKFRGTVEPVAPSMTDKGVVFIEQSKVEIAEAEKMREALRNRDIPPYFESEQYRERSPVQSPDMKYFSSKLAKARDGTTMSRSTLKSSTLSLMLDDSGSTLQGFNSTKEQVDSSPSQMTDGRPINPTPKVATIGRELSNTDITTLEEVSRPAVSVADKSTSENTVSPIPILQSQQRVEPNTKYALIEAPVRRKVKTSSILSGASKLRGFRVSPTDITFGVLREGSTYKLKLKLKNIGVDSAHFKVRQPPPSTGIKIIYTPGAVAAGLTRTLTVEIFAMAVGAVGDQKSGYISHELQIVTETDVIYIPIRADVLTKTYYDINSSFCRQGHGVELVVANSNRPRPLKV